MPRLLALALSLAAATPARAQAPELTADLRLDLPITAVTLTAWLTTELLKPQLAPRACTTWCDPSPLDASTRTALRWATPGTADTLSTVSAYAVVPLASLGLLALSAWHDDALAGLPVDALVVAEAVGLAGALNQLVKFASGRERPFVHALPAETKPTTNEPADNDLSFYSGHTSFTFSLAVAAGTVASLRGERLAPLVWAAGLTLAATTGYLRIAADRHYLSDVLVGAAVGGAIGALVPLLFHAPRPPAVPTPGVTTLPGGGVVTAAWAW